MIKNIEIPYYITKGTKGMKKHCPEKINIIAIDTETFEGEPYTIQFVTSEDADIVYVNKDNVTEIFLHEIEKRIKPKEFNIIYGHNLQFDLSIIFFPMQKLFIKDQFTIKYGDITIMVYTGKLFFAEIYFKDTKVLFYDTFRFVMTSLDKACIDLNLPIKKLPIPDGLGEKKLKTREFKEYAINDARIQYILSSWIIDRCRDYNIPIPISVAQFAQYVFRKNFLGERPLTFPPSDAVYMSLLSYHGGKNGCYVDTPTMQKDIYAYDIISAYPYAMTKLPSFIGGEYKRTNTISDKYEGIYQITGDYIPCQYGNLFDHKFKRITDTKIIDKCFTSYEIKDAIKHKELKIDKIEGWIFIPDNATDNPLKAYVDHFFDIKKTAKDLTQKWIAKICLNSLYGKFIQTNESITNEKLILSVNKNLLKIEDIIYKAGGMFNPFIGSLITAHTRVYCHNLEHKYKAIHTATDSIFTKETNVITGDNLGDLKFEGSGDLLLLRNKLYVHFDKHPEDIIIKKNPINNKPYIESGIRKYALHGFHAKIIDLIKLWKDRKINYKYNKMTLIKESIIQVNKNRKANIFNDYESTLKIDWNKYYEE